MLLRGKEKSRRYKQTVFRKQIDAQKEDAPSIKGGGVYTGKDTVATNWRGSPEESIRDREERGSNLLATEGRFKNRVGGWHKWKAFPNNVEAEGHELVAAPVHQRHSLIFSFTNFWVQIELRCLKVPKWRHRRKQWSWRFYEIMVQVQQYWVHIKLSQNGKGEDKGRNGGTINLESLIEEE